MVSVGVVTSVGISVKTDGVGAESGLALLALEQRISFGDGAVWLPLFWSELSAFRQWFMLAAAGSSGFEAVEVGAIGVGAMVSVGDGAVALSRVAAVCVRALGVGTLVYVGSNGFRRLWGHLRFWGQMPMPKKQRKGHKGAIR